MAVSDRTFKLEPGLQDLLTLAIEHRLQARIDGWREQVEAGVIDQEARQAFIALGWVTQRDVRVVAQGRAVGRTAAVVGAVKKSLPEPKPQEEPALAGAEA